MCPSEGDGNEFHSVAKEVFGKVIDLDDFQVVVVKLDVFVEYWLVVDCSHELVLEQWS